MSIKNNVIFHESCCVIYKRFPAGKKSQKNSKSLANLNKVHANGYNGFMSDATARKAKKMINCLLLAIKHTHGKKSTFVTLTLPAIQKHDDNFIKKNLFADRFMKVMKKKFKTQHYFWRAEPQKNGNIHFHVLFDIFIPWQDIRGNWNFILKCYGYLDDYKTAQLSKHVGGFTYQDYSNSISRKKQFQYYLKKERAKRNATLDFRNWDEARQREAYNYGVSTNWENPNSTDIHAIRKVRNVGAYITKYMTKTPAKVDLHNATPEQKLGEYRAIKGRIWGASDSLRDLRYFEDFLDEESYEGQLVDFNPLVADYLDELRDSGMKIKVINDMVSVLMLEKGQEQSLKLFSPVLYTEYMRYYKNQAKILYP